MAVLKTGENLQRQLKILKKRKKRKLKKDKAYFQENDTCPEVPPSWLLRKKRPPEQSLASKDKTGLPDAKTFPKPLDWI